MQMTGQIFMSDGKFHEGRISCNNGIIADVSACDADEDIYIIPGLTDIHFHGASGHDFCDATREAFCAIAEYEARRGITSICPATMSLPEGDLLRIVSSARAFGQFAGIHLEGPFLSRARPGAQNRAYIIAPDVELFMRLQKASGGLIRIVTIAPELDGADEFMRKVQDVVISIGHTACDYDIAMRAFELGASHVTHIYNTMNQIEHRSPGPVIAAVENACVDVELICDGVHVHPAVVRNTLRMFGDNRVIFISDSMEATGLADGEYMLGGQKVIKSANRATLVDGVTIAGSVTDLMDCLKIAVRDMNVPLEVAVKCAAINPARAIGLDARLIPGNRANLVVLDRELNILQVLINGKVIE